MRKESENAGSEIQVEQNGVMDGHVATAVRRVSDYAARLLHEGTASCQRSEETSRVAENEDATEEMKLARTFTWNGFLEIFQDMKMKRINFWKLI